MQFSIAKRASRRQKPAMHSPPNNTEKPRFGEFFAGIGLMRLGLESGNWQVVFANDIDED